jgi:hypothetical protein
MSTLTGQDISLDIGFGTIPLVVYGAIGITSIIIAATTVSQITSSGSQSSESSSAPEPTPEPTPEPEAPPEEKQGGMKKGKHKKTKGKKPKANHKYTRAHK